MAEYIIKGDPGAEGHDGRALAADEADVVEVVRCKDCKRWIRFEPEVETGRCTKHNDRIARWTDDFCSYGERKE